MVVGIGNLEKNSNMHHKPKYPCKICKVTTSLSIVLVFLRYWKYGQEILINLLLIHRLVIVRFLGKRVRLGFPVGYAKGFTIVTFSLIWMKPQIIGKTYYFMETTSN